MWEDIKQAGGSSMQAKENTYLIMPDPIYSGF